jgi:hypothetical protein
MFSFSITNVFKKHFFKISFTLLDTLSNFIYKSYIKYKSASMCAALSCRPSTITSICQFSPLVGASNPPIGAAVGTTCASGKICDQGECVANSVAPVGECVHGDDVVTSENSGLNSDLTSRFPNIQNTCEQIITFLASQNLFPLAYCTKNTQFASTCCQTCKSKFMFLIFLFA